MLEACFALLTIKLESEERKVQTSANKLYKQVSGE